MAAGSRRGKKLVDEKAGSGESFGRAIPARPAACSSAPLGLEVSASVNPRLTPFGRLSGQAVNCVLALLRSCRRHATAIAKIPLNSDLTIGRLRLSRFPVVFLRRD